MLPVTVLLIVVASLGCGGRLGDQTVLADGASAGDAFADESSPGSLDGSSIDTRATDASSADVRDSNTGRLDGGFFRTCKKADGDRCEGGAGTCYGGQCCAGERVGDVCRCGEGFGCDFYHACCRPPESTPSSPLGCYTAHECGFDRP